MEEAELSRYIEVLQARKNKMALGKRQMDLLKPVLPKMDQPKEVFSAENMYQAPSTKPLLSTPVPLVHAPTPQFRYLAPIKSKVNASTRFYPKKSTSQLKSCWPWLPRSGGIKNR